MYVLPIEEEYIIFENPIYSDSKPRIQNNQHLFEYEQPKYVWINQYCILFWVIIITVTILLILYFIHIL